MNDYEQHADEEREYPTAAEEKAAEIALDIADEERHAAEEAQAESPRECEGEFIDGTWYGDGCDGCVAQMADDEAEWRPGECDHCFGQTVSSPFGDIYCACAIGQGADPDDCVCGPEDGDEG
ncbi:hypothetical protein CG740_23365 [Streptomyces sp. CB01201]|uniref:hypothetical protein n=1 Tax=Streptomyces sp. CB01201 TaxID=2020324 RepID=UPI000C270B5F|nr:hypothetical protein [Streptomyces sp. CB01201]PJN00845.1 hypothetical protein CG740_23365 [Streptomyces sp. CB01201]